MRIAYLYDQPLSDANHMSADRTYVDTRDTKRLFLGDMVDKGGVLAGDTVVITALSKLGHGGGASRIVSKIEKLGAGVEVSPAPQRPKTKRGRKKPVSDEKLAWAAVLWAGADGPDEVITQVSEAFGFQVDRNWMNYNVGGRDGQPAGKLKHRNSEEAE
jgi:hypothetical protein